MAKFRKARIGEYIEWLKAYLYAGHKPTHYYGYPWEHNGFLVATSDFVLGGECGACARSIIVPQGVRCLGGDLGHNHLYYVDGPRYVGFGVVPVYTDTAFATLPLRTFIAAKEGQDREYKRQMVAQENEDRRRRAGSDLSKFTGR